MNSENAVVALLAIVVIAQTAYYFLSLFLLLRSRKQKAGQLKPKKKNKEYTLEDLAKLELLDIRNWVLNACQRASAEYFENEILPVCRFADKRTELIFGPLHYTCTTENYAKAMFAHRDQDYKL